VTVLLGELARWRSTLTKSMRRCWPCYTLHDGVRAWKGHDWDALDRLHRKDMIYDPVGKTKSVVFTDAGLARARGCSENCLRGPRREIGRRPGGGSDQAAAASGKRKFQGRLCRYRHNLPWNLASVRARLDRREAA